MHVFLHFGTFGLEVLQLILASKLSELEHLENFQQITTLDSKKSENVTKIKLMPLPSNKKGVNG